MELMRYRLFKQQEELKRKEQEAKERRLEGGIRRGLDFLSLDFVSLPVVLNPFFSSNLVLYVGKLGVGLPWHVFQCYKMAPGRYRVLDIGCALFRNGGGFLPGMSSKCAESGVGMKDSSVCFSLGTPTFTIFDRLLPCVCDERKLGVCARLSPSPMTSLLTFDAILCAAGRP